MRSLQLVHRVLSYWIRANVAPIAVGHQLSAEPDSMPGARKHSVLNGKRGALGGYLSRFDRHCTLIRAATYATMRGSLESCDPLFALIRPRPDAPNADVAEMLPSGKPSPLLADWPDFFLHPVLVDRDAHRPKGWNIVARRLLALREIYAVNTPEADRKRGTDFPSLVQEGKTWFVEYMKVVWSDAQGRGTASSFPVLQAQVLESIERTLGWDLLLSVNGTEDSDLGVLRISSQIKEGKVTFGFVWLARDPHELASGLCEQTKTAGVPMLSGTKNDFGFTLDGFSPEDLDAWIGQAPSDRPEGVGSLTHGTEKVDVTWRLDGSTNPKGFKLHADST